MIYKIDHYYAADDEPSSLLIESFYTEDEFLLLTAVLQYYAEELFGDHGILLGNDCLRKILCGFYGAKDVSGTYENILPKDFKTSKYCINRDLCSHIKDVPATQFNRYIVREQLSDADIISSMHRFIPVCPDREKALRELIFREGLS